MTDKMSWREEKDGTFTRLKNGEPMGPCKHVHKDAPVNSKCEDCYNE